MKQINLPPTNRETAKRVRSRPRDWIIGAAAMVTFLLMLAVALGSLFWLALKIWSAALSMM